MPYNQAQLNAAIELLLKLEELKTRRLLPPNPLAEYIEALKVKIDQTLDLGPD